MRSGLLGAPMRVPRLGAVSIELWPAGVEGKRTGEAVMQWHAVGRVVAPSARRRGAAAAGLGGALGGHRLRPSSGLGSSLAMSMPSRQRTLMANISLPSLDLPRAN